MKTIYLLGNPLIEQDASPIRLSAKLKTELLNYNFVHLDPTENLPEENHLMLIDTILDLKEVRTLSEKDLEKIQNSPTISMHDFDLALQLKLAKKLGTINKVTIIGIPPQGNDEEIIKKIKEILSNSHLREQ